MPIITRNGKRGHMKGGRFVPVGKKKAKHIAKRKGK